MHPLNKDITLLLLSSKSMKTLENSHKGVGICPVLGATELLADPQHQSLLQQIRSHSGLDEEAYGLFYDRLITKFVERVQVLPYQVGGKPGGLINYSLERAAAALQEYHRHTKEEFSALYAYAVFSALLLQDIGKIISNQLVFICDSEGRVIDEWLPTEASMVGQGEFYKFYVIGDQWLTLGRLATSVLARQCMPELGFSWLSEDWHILQMWFELLAGDKQRVMHFIPSQQFIHQPSKDLLPVVPAKILHPPQTALGEEFIYWLSEGLCDGSIAVNTPDAAIHMLENGELFMDQRIFQNFVAGYGKNVHWTVVAKQYNYLGLSKLSGGDLVWEKFYSESAEHAAQKQSGGLFFNVAEKKSHTVVREGLVIKRAEALFRNRSIPPVSPLNLKPATQVAIFHHHHNHDHKHRGLSKKILAKIAKKLTKLRARKAARQKILRRRAEG